MDNHSVFNLPRTQTLCHLRLKTLLYKAVYLSNTIEHHGVLIEWQLNDLFNILLMLTKKTQKKHNKIHNLNPCQENPIMRKAFPRQGGIMRNCQGNAVKSCAGDVALRPCCPSMSWSCYIWWNTHCCGMALGYNWPKCYYKHELFPQYFQY